MKRALFFLFLFVCVLIVCCENDNIEEKYFQSIPEDTLDNPIDTNGLPNIVKPQGEIAWFPLNGSLIDTSGNNIPLILVGDTNYVQGLNSEYGQGLHLDGSSYLLVNLGYYDTLSVVLWLKGDQEIGNPNEPVIFDYGLNTISSVLLDGTTGATALEIQKNGFIASSEKSTVEYLNSFNRYSFFYFEAGGDFAKVYFKGYSSTGEEIIYKDEFNAPGILDPQSEILYIGRSSVRETMNNSFFRGALDEIHIYSRCLTDEEVESFAFTHTE